MDQDWRRRTEIAQRRQREIRCDAPAGFKGFVRRFERVGVTAAETGVRGHGFRRNRLEVRASVAPSLQPRLCGSTWARPGFARSARRSRGLDPPSVLPFESAITGATAWCVRTN